VVIGKIDDVRFSMWGVDINSPYSGILPASEVFGREKKELSRVFDIGDVLFLRIVDVDEVKKVKLGLKGRGMGKFKGGVIVDIAPTKVPRLIGKKGSMINMIKDKTGCKIVVGQNGLVWVKGNEDMEQIVKNVIKLIEKEAHTSGLTDRIKNKLCLLIDGELPPEEDEIEESEQADEYEEDSFEEGLKKPELQDFRDEVEKELAEELANEESDDDFEDFDDDLDDDSDEDEEDLEDFNDDSEDEEGFEDFDDDLDDDSDEDEDFEDSEDEDDFEDFDDDLDDDSEDEDEDFEDSEDEEDESEEDADDDSEEEIEESEEDISDEQLEDVINDAISEDEDSSEDADLVEDEENDDLEASEEDADEDSEDKEEEAKEDSEEEKEEKSKKPKFLDTFEYINEQKKKNKSSFDFSRADNSKSPTLNISQGRGI